MAKPGKPRSTPPKYPAIYDAIERKGGTYRFLMETHINPTTYYNLQRGDGNPTMLTINTILDYVGLTYEEAFRTENAAMRVQDA